MKAKVFIERLAVDTVIGICDWEQGVEQTLYFDIDMEVDIGAVAESDSIEDALDYASVADCVDKFVKANKATLLESMLTQLMRYLLNEFAVIEELEITVRKPQAIGQADCAGVSTFMSRVCLSA